MYNIISKIFNDKFDVPDGEKKNDSVEDRFINTATLDNINVEYIRGVTEFEDYDWFIKIIMDKVDSNALVFVDLKSIRNEGQRHVVKSKIREHSMRKKGSFRELRKDQNLWLVASENLSRLIEDMSVGEISKEKRIKIVRNLKLGEDCGSMLSNVVDAYADGSSLIVDLSTEVVEEDVHDKFHCLLGASMAIKGSYRVVDKEQHVFIFAPGDAITTFENFA